MSIATRSYLTAAQSARIDRILDATKKLIGDLGADRLTMRDVAAASEVAERTLYNRFGTKDALIAIAVLDYFDKSIRLMAEHHRASTALRQVLFGIELVANEILGAQSFTRGLIAACFKLDGAREMPRKLTESLLDYWRPILERMRQEKSLQPWASIPLLCQELTARQLGVPFAFVQGDFPDKEFRDRLSFGIFTILLGVSRGQQAKEIDTLLAKLSAKLGP